MQVLNDLMRKLLGKIIKIPETAAFFKVFTAQTPDGQPRGRLLMSNRVRMTKERLKPVMVALNAACDVMRHRAIKDNQHWPENITPIAVVGAKKETAPYRRSAPRPVRVRVRVRVRVGRSSRLIRSRLATVDLVLVGGQNIVSFGQSFFRFLKNRFPPILLSSCLASLPPHYYHYSCID